MPSDVEAPAPKYRIRVANQAVIIRDGTLLVTENHGERGAGDDWLALPGGGQEWGEDAVSAMRRECREEIGCDVVVGDLLGVRDYVAKNHEFGDLDAEFHQQENFFACTLPIGAEPGAGTQWDTFQTGLRWLPLSELPTAPIYPKILRTWLLADPVTRPRYLGDVN